MRGVPILGGSRPMDRKGHSVSGEHPRAERVPKPVRAVPTSYYKIPPGQAKKMARSHSYRPAKPSRTRTTETGTPPRPWEDTSYTRT